MQKFRYLIGAKSQPPGAAGETTMVAYDQSRAPLGTTAGYCNLFVEAGEVPGYEPYLKKDGTTAADYDEGIPDPRGPGYKKNITEQMDRRRADGVTLIEQDNADTFAELDYFDDVIAALDWAHISGLSVLAKNPNLLNGADALRYLQHPAIVGCIVERADNAFPEVLHELRRLAGKRDIPVYFVAFDKGGSTSGKQWIDEVARDISTHENMQASYSPNGEYTTAQIIISSGEEPTVPPLPANKVPEWLSVMRASSGIVETPGAADNPKIMGMATEIAETYPEMKSYCAQYNHDSIPWCGLSAAYCMTMAGIRPPFGPTDTDKFLWAKAWADDPEFTLLDAPRLGCVVVLTRSGGGHVTFYERTEGSYYVCCGGNQSDAINSAKFPKSGVVALTWPNAAGPLPPDAVPEPSERRTLQKGDTGADVAALQVAIGVPADGDFGAVTESGVKGFQAGMGLDADGVVGSQTWAAVDALTAKMTAGSDGLPDALVTAIVELARNSDIAGHVWPSRGRAPAGYIPGMACSFALAAAWLDNNEPAAVGMAVADKNDPANDALTWYRSEFQSHGMDNSKPGIDTLRHLFDLLIALGPRESSGRYCEGTDVAAAGGTTRAADEIEAGLFQTSWNIRSASPLMQPLFDQYMIDPNGFHHVFDDGVTPRGPDLHNVGAGGGAGKTYQWLAKYAPAFAVMTTAIGTRTRRQHWGPINRKELDSASFPKANKLLLDIQNLMETFEPPEPVEPEPGPEPEVAEVTITVTSKGKVKVVINDDSTV